MNDPLLSLRAASVKDAQAIVELAQSAYRGESSRAGWTTEADLLDGQRIDRAGILSMLEGDQCLLLAHRNQHLVGCCHVRLDADGCWFGLFAVTPHLQGQGIGDALLNGAEQVAMRDLGASRMKMKVIWVRDSLIAWYVRRGYSITRETHPFPYGDERFGMPRRDDLYFSVLHKSLAP